MRTMVPLSSQRRHRLHGEEIPEVLRGLELRLREHLETERDLLGATIAFRAFYRLLEHRPGRPNYPEPVTWNVIAEWIHLYRQARAVGGVAHIYQAERLDTDP